MSSGRNRYVYIFLTLMAAFCGLIWAITNLSYDGEYQISMAYRLLQGDKMFLEMWEPNQTSVFLPAALMWIYRKLFHTTTGIALYLQVCGILIRGALAYLLYRTLREDLDRPLAYGIGLLFFMVSPKDLATPEYSNIQLWYCTLLFCCLWTFLKKQKLYLLLLSALWLCLEALTYPSCAIVLFGVILLLAFYTTHKRRDILLLTGICAVLGLSFLCYFLFTIGPDTFMKCITGMLAIEPTHTISGSSKLQGYLSSLLKISLTFAFIGAAGFLVSLVPVRLLPIRLGKQQPARQRRPARWLYCCITIMLVGFLMNILSADNRSAYSIILLSILGAGFRNRNVLSGNQKKIYICGSMIGGLSLLATLLLTDHPMITVSVPYGLLAVCAALIPIWEKLGQSPYAPLKKRFCYCFLCFLILLAFRCIFVRVPLSGKGQVCSTFSDLSIVRTGPALGIISNEDGVCIQRDSYPEWKESIPPGSKVWIVGSVVDTLGYLYEDVEVAGPSTMSTPSYNEAVLEYWRLNPGKYPDIIVAEGYLGEISYELSGNQWLLSFIEEEFQPEYVVYGTYWNYYFRKEPDLIK